MSMTQAAGNRRWSLLQGLESGVLGLGLGLSEIGLGAYLTLCSLFGDMGALRARVESLP